MEFKNIPNMGRTLSGRPLVIDESKDEGIQGTVLCSNLVTPVLQELYNAIVMSGMSPSPDNTQLYQLLKRFQDNITNLQAEENTLQNGLQQLNNTVNADMQEVAQHFADLAQAIHDGNEELANTLSGLIGHIITVTDATNNAQINEEINNRQQAVSNEIAARQAAIAQEVTDRNNAIAQEASSLRSEIEQDVSNSIAQEATNRNNAISQEVADRNNAITAAINSEAAAREQADNALQQAITNNNSTSSALTQEIADRKAADSNLSQQITGCNTEIASILKQIAGLSSSGSSTTPTVVGHPLINIQFWNKGGKYTCTVSSKTNYVRIRMVGGGGGGGGVGAAYNNLPNGGCAASFGGYGGQYIETNLILVNPGQQVPVTVGSGGAGGVGALLNNSPVPSTGINVYSQVISQIQSANASSTPLNFMVGGNGGISVVSSLSVGELLCVGGWGGSGSIITGLGPYALTMVDGSYPVSTINSNAASSFVNTASMGLPSGPSINPFILPNGSSPSSYAGANITTSAGGQTPFGQGGYSQSSTFYLASYLSNAIISPLYTTPVATQQYGDTLDGGAGGVSAVSAWEDAVAGSGAGSGGAGTVGIIGVNSSIFMSQNGPFDSLSSSGIANGGAGADGLVIIEEYA